MKMIRAYGWLKWSRTHGWVVFVADVNFRGNILWKQWRVAIVVYSCEELFHSWRLRSNSSSSSNHRQQQPTVAAKKFFQRKKGAPSATTMNITKIETTIFPCWTLHNWRKKWVNCMCVAINDWFLTEVFGSLLKSAKKKCNCENGVRGNRLTKVPSSQAGL